MTQKKKKMSLYFQPRTLMIHYFKTVEITLQVKLDIYKTTTTVNKKKNRLSVCMYTLRFDENQKLKKKKKITHFLGRYETLIVDHPTNNSYSLENNSRIVS